MYEDPSVEVLDKVVVAVVVVVVVVVVVDEVVECVGGGCVERAT